MLLFNHLKQIDIQDIAVFLTLMRLQSAKRTAEELNVSQSTVSYCLKKLRFCFDDILFTPNDNGMLPTVRAQSILPYMQLALDSINQCAEIDKSLSNQAKVWRISAPEYFELSILPCILKIIATENSNNSLHVQKLAQDLPLEQLFTGDIDVAFGFGPGYHRLHPNLKWESIVNDDFYCLTTYRQENNNMMDIDYFCKSPHVFPTPWQSDENMIDGWLKRMGKNRRILTSANSYQACINIITQVPATLSIPKKLVPFLNIPDGVDILSPPLGFPNFTLDMIWAKSRTKSPAVMELRKIISQLNTRL